MSRECGRRGSLGSRVAIKVLSEACAKDAELVERFFAEARAVNPIGTSTSSR